MSQVTLADAALAVPIGGDSRAEIACAHCGLPCLNLCVSRSGKDFCCTGCRTVYEILTENGLGHFYELSKEAGVQIKRTPRREQFVYLDEPAVREKLIDFTDGKVSHVTFTAPGIHCIACVWLLENLFRLNPGVGRSKVNFPRREVSIQFQHDKITLGELAALLASLGYEPTLSFGTLEAKPPKNAQPGRLLLRLGIAGFAFGNIMLISLCLYTGLDSLSTVRFKPLFGWASVLLALPVVVYSAADYWRSAWTCVRRRILTIELPIAIGLVAIMAQSLYEVVRGTGAGYFDSLCGLIFFLLIGRWFQQKTYDRLSFDRDYKSFFPLSVIRKIGANEESVPLSALSVGDHLLLRRGELIPADAVIVNGQGAIDYSFVTGESEPVHKGAGETVYAGGQQTGVLLEVKIVKPVSQSYLTSLWSHETFAKERDLTLDTILNRYTKRFTLTVLAVAVGAAIWWCGHGQAGVAVKAFSSVLIVACPCALALSAPFALGTAQRLLGRRHIFLKSPQMIETLARVDTIVFDKTGTLTSPGAGDVEFRGPPLSEAEERRLYSVAGHSTHPLPARICKALAPAHTREEVRSFRESEGEGMQGTVEGRQILMGSAAWLKSHGIAMGHTDPRVESGRDSDGRPSPAPPHNNGSLVHVALDGGYRGCFHFAARLRAQADTLIARLSSRYELALLSGDHARERDQFRNLFGDGASLHFNQSPQNKLGFIEQLQRSGKSVMMVGDGLNDAGALKQSDAGVAVVEEVGAFSPASDVIIEANNVPLLAGMLGFSKSAVRVVWLSIFISTVYNVAGLAIAASGNLSPVVCAVLMPLSSVSVVAFACGATHWMGLRAGLKQTGSAPTLKGAG
jgi:Cu+-exporting ATPase